MLTTTTFTNMNATLFALNYRPTTRSREIRLALDVLDSLPTVNEPCDVEDIDNLSDALNTPTAIDTLLTEIIMTDDTPSLANALARADELGIGRCDRNAPKHVRRETFDLLDWLTAWRSK